jgi:hypothetical protein
VVTLALETIEALEFGYIGFAHSADTQDEKPGSYRAAACNPDLPPVAGGVENCRIHPGVETDVPGQVQLAIDMVEVAPQLLPGRKLLAPVPVLPDTVDGIFIIRHMGVHPGPGVTIPVPGAAQFRARLKQLYPETLLAQQVELVEATETGADYQGVEFGVRSMLRRR